MPKNWSAIACSLGLVAVCLLAGCGTEEPPEASPEARNRLFKMIYSDQGAKMVQGLVSKKSGFSRYNLPQDVEPKNDVEP